MGQGPCTSASVSCVTSAKGTSPTRSPVYCDSQSAGVHVPRNGVDHQESGFRGPVQGDRMVAEVKAIIHCRCTDGAHLSMHYGSSRSRVHLVVDVHVARLFSRLLDRISS